MDDVRGTARLRLCRPAADDLDELFGLYSDPRLAAADHLLAHSSIEQTRSVLERRIAQWHQDGLGLWVLRASDAGDHEDDVIGIGGCSLVADTAWNLSFSLVPRHWGKGYAQEVAAAAVGQARLLRPELPVTAVVAERNARSHRTVVRAGLVRVWEGRDHHDLDPAARVSLYADRPLGPGQIDRLTT